MRKKKTKSIIETLIRFKYQLCVFMFIENFLQNKWNNIWFVKNASRYNSRNFFYSSIIWFLIKWKVFFFRNFETQSHRMRDPGIFVNSFGPSVQKKEKLCWYLVNVVGLSKWISTIIDCVLTECLNISLAISMDDLWSGTRLKIEKCKWKISCFQKSYSIFTFGCIKTNGNSAETSPPSAPKKSLTLTAYETMIPNASRFSGVARLQKKNKNQQNVRFEFNWFNLNLQCCRSQVAFFTFHLSIQCNTLAIAIIAQQWHQIHGLLHTWAWIYWASFTCLNRCNRITILSILE